ncbi:MAG: secretin N-terminal domain-containing protein [bacterium]
MGSTQRSILVLAALLMTAAPSEALAQQRAAAGDVIPVVKLENAAVKSAVDFIAEWGDINIVTDSGVTGTVTLSLREVHWADALAAVMAQQDLVSIPSVEVIRDGLPAGTEFALLLTRSAYNTRQQQQLQQQRDIETSQPLVTRIIRLENSRAQEIQTAVQPLASTDGVLNIDTRTNSLIVRDYPENIDLIQQVIQNVDITVPQIRIEAKLLEVDNDKLRELGLEWDLNVEVGGNPLVITQSTNLGASDAIRGQLAFASGTMSLDGTISALETQGTANLVATPSISVLDNQEGRVFMGEQIPLRQLDVAGNVTIQLQQVGTELIVTPHVVQGDRIILELQPKRESFRVDPSAGIIITTQESQTTVEVRDGETAVIGGLKSETVTTADTGVPILMDIPILGAAFRYRRTETQVRDLILFVTPRIERDTRVNRP